jgi:WD40 repeat protein
MKSKHSQDIPRLVQVVVSLHMIIVGWCLSLRTKQSNSGMSLLATLSKTLTCSSPITCLSCSPTNNKQVVVSLEDKTLQIWDIDKDKIHTVLTGHSKIVQCCKYFPNGRLILSASQDKTLKKWDAVSGEEVTTYSGHTQNIEVQVGISQSTFGMKNQIRSFLC